MPSCRNKPRIITFVEIRYVTVTKDITDLDKTSIGDGTYYTWGNK